LPRVSGNIAAFTHATLESLTALWHLSNYIPNLCICNWLLGFNTSCPQPLVILMNGRVLFLNDFLQSIPYLLNWTEVPREWRPPDWDNSICRKLLFGDSVYGCMSRSIILLKLKPWMWLKDIREMKK
jgi:hypothetical protein